MDNVKPLSICIFSTVLCLTAYGYILFLDIHYIRLKLTSPYPYPLWFYKHHSFFFFSFFSAKAGSPMCSIGFLNSETADILNQIILC